MPVWSDNSTFWVCTPRLSTTTTSTSSSIARHARRPAHTLAASSR
jgi:hypothetical protein